MDYLDMIRDMAGGEDKVKEESARAVINGARDRLDELEEKVRGRVGGDGSGGAGTDGTDLNGIPDDLQKPRSEHDRQSRAKFYEAAREAGRDPNEAWEELPAGDN